MSFQSVWLTATFAIVVSAAVHAEVSTQELKAKTDYCKTCHGAGRAGVFADRFRCRGLRDNSQSILKNQLQAFIERRRTNPVMFNVSHVLSPSMVKGLADHFKSLDPKPLGGAPRDHIAEGRKIYLEGAGANIPPCASCHGPEAKGTDVFPRLAGHSYYYIIRKLTNWDKERGQDKAKPDNSAIMQPIAHDLTEAQIKAVAEYLSYLE